jgi:NAD(P)-dependent dehydrogenase (short-subunit alcohol dehydrogenase family)
MSRILENQCAIITGASQGMGFAIARKFLDAGANLMICARDAELLDCAAKELANVAGKGQVVISMAADVSNSAAVAKVVETALQEFGRLNILVNNAGVVGPIGAVDEVDWDEWVRAIQINLLGPVLLSRAVLAHFKQFGRGKIIQLSGGGATQPLPMLSAYAASKAAVVRFVETLAEETRQHHIDVNALAPGALNTRLLDEFIAAGPQRIGRAFHERALQQRLDGGTPLAVAADLALFLASPQSDGITGKLISAVWDPWKNLPDRLDDLNETDIYTLRRILPKDRGMVWGDMNDHRA